MRFLAGLKNEDEAYYFILKNETKAVNGGYHITCIALLLYCHLYLSANL